MEWNKNLVNAIFQKLFNNFSESVFWTNSENQYLGCNKHYYQLLGLNHSIKITDFSVNTLLNTLGISTKEAFNPISTDIFFEKTYYFNNGKQINVKGKKISFLKNTIYIEEDISDYHSEIELLKSAYNTLKNDKDKIEAYLNNLIQIVPASIYWKDTNSVILGDNLLHAKIAGLDGTKDSIGKTDYDFVWKKQAAQIIENDKMIMHSKKGLKLEEIAALNDGKVHTFLTSKEPMFDKNQNVIGIIGVSLDITELKEVQKELEKAKEAAEAGEHAKTEFIANVSHDIRTPLTGLVDLAHDIDDSSLSLEIKALLAQIADSGDALYEMMVGILDSVTAENATEADIERVTFDINLLAKKLSALEKPTATHKGLEFITHVDSNIPTYLVGDYHKIHRINLNLLGNSLKFTKQGHIELKIELAEKKSDTVILKFNIIDTGIGVAPEDKQRLFLRFYKGSPSYKGEYKGYGLGLNVVKSFTSLLGGSIDFDSTQGVGTHFCVTLPLRIANQEEIDIYQKKLSEKKSSLTKINPQEPSVANIEIQELHNAPHVLVVEDDPMARNILLRKIKKIGLHVMEAGDGEAALELAKNYHFDLIFSDVGLPGMSGLELTRQIRIFEKAYHKESVPIIGVSGHASNECLEAGMTASMSKPLTAEAFTEIIQTYLPKFKL